MKKKVYVLLAAAVAATLLLCGFLYQEKQDRLNLERVLFANELAERTITMRGFVAALNEYPGNEDALDQLEQYRFRNDVNLMHDFTSYNMEKYPRFLRDFDMLLYQTLHNVQEMAPELSDSELEFVRSEIDDVRNTLARSVTWGHGGNRWGNNIDLEFPAEDMNLIIDSLYDINQSLSEKG
ncbi:hypothetical protein JSY36_09630 [Bacillus sp. H-16]|uniref:hypothetical protein n=1 Tax=Alteribacter salitolerans TaxID=2912333 RepID=UPI001964BE07|nr:hypothetical protein [Alteribacter salitolerans]MBM7096016.1 hypothetical protein [Alteribacter salitolerans]